MTATATLTVAGESESATESSDLWFDASNKVLGSTGDDAECTALSVTALPARVQPGSSGPWFISSCYHRSTNLLVVSPVSYVVEAETATTALFKMITQTPASGSVMPQTTVTTTFRLGADGSFVRVREDVSVVEAGGSLALTTTYQ